MMRIIGFILFAIVFVTMVLIGVANWAFPKGESYPTGEYAEDYGGRGGEIWESGPSPMSNPDWVRFVQDNDNALFFVMLFNMTVGILLVVWNRSEANNSDS
ncbi:MAG: hypothetical protein MUO89_00330 [Dehalococcoidia bacterium]|nr:hypothetical protein [Dehalococcoidia bacterium]